MATVTEPVHVTAKGIIAQMRPGSLSCTEQPVCVSMLPFALLSARAVVGRTQGEYKSHLFSLFSLFSPPLCCAMEPRRANLGRTTFLFSAGESPQRFLCELPFLIIHFPQKTLEVRTKKLYSPEARYSPLRCTREG